MFHENPEYTAHKFFQKHPEAVNTWETFNGLVESLLGSNHNSGFLRLEQRVLTNLADSIFLPEEEERKKEFLSIVKLFRQTAYHEFLRDCRKLQKNLTGATDSKISEKPNNIADLKEFTMYCLTLSHHIQSYLSTFAHVISTGYHIPTKKYKVANTYFQRKLDEVQQMARQNIFGVPELYEEKSN